MFKTVLICLSAAKLAAAASGGGERYRTLSEETLKTLPPAIQKLYREKYASIAAASEAKHWPKQTRNSQQPEYAAKTGEPTRKAMLSSLGRNQGRKARRQRLHQRSQCTKQRPSSKRASEAGQT